MMYKNIYEEIDAKVKLLEEYSFCALATGQYVEAGVVEDSAALLVRLKIILKTLDQLESESNT